MHPVHLPPRIANGGPGLPPLAYVRRPPGREQFASIAVAHETRRGTEAEPERAMSDLARKARTSAVTKWCVGVLLLLAPGSFVILPLVWLARHLAARGAALTRNRERRPVE